MFYMVEKLFCFYIANNVGGLRFYFFLSQRYTEYIIQINFREYEKISEHFIHLI